MRALGIIPARMASTRFPGKPLAQIAGKPMLWHVWAAAAKSRLLWQTFVATADKEIIDWCEFVGANYIVTRSDCRNGTERCHDAMRQLAQRDADEIVVNIQGDEPTIRPEAIDALVRAFNKPEVMIASLCFRPQTLGFISDRNRVKVLADAAGDALGFQRSVLQTHLWPLYLQHIGVYAYRREVLARIAGLQAQGSLEQEPWTEAGYRIRMVEIEAGTVSVDRPEDVVEIERLGLLRAHSTALTV
jgi:3-deoxy-manno-octulosonate cytidylyltransferase (CMP-KDO synthetase)